jgi:mannose-6-phosphate isomerase-like protein (cupin superfamily)
MWRLGSQEDVVPVECEAAITMPIGTYFQFRSFGYEPLSTIGTPMPPWAGQGEEEYYEVPGKWTPTLGT